jgi:hypothetical protein
MVGIRKIGIFWGNTALHFVECDGSAPIKILNIPFNEEHKESMKGGPLSPGGMELISNIGNTLRKQKVTTTSVNLSLPAKDIIFRSFVIPWMQSHEISNVVEFEASKYIPFSLGELCFSFYSINITENNTKRMRVIFVAIKKDTLENYIKILKDASLTVDAIEPAASSLIRALSFKDLIPRDQTVALIEKEDVGRIIVVDNGIPQFVREFHLSPDADQGPQGDPEAEIKKLTKEVHISLDYFSRQNEQLQVKKIFLLASSQLKEFSKDLENNLNMQVAVLDEQSIMGAASKDIGLLNAYGVCLITPLNAKVDFDFTKKTTEKTRKVKQVVERKPIAYKSIIKTALVCVPLMVGAFIASEVQTQKLRQEISVANKKLGSFQDADIAMIEQKEADIKLKLTRFQKTRIKSSVSLFLLNIPEFLPKGIWLSSLNIAYDDSETLKSDNATKTVVINMPPSKLDLIVTFEGYAYSKNNNNQFQLINTFLKNLKNDKEFSSIFQNIILETTKAQKLDDNEVTAFKIVCERGNESKRLK